MRIVLATYGSRGDVEPVVALAVELQALGAKVSMCAPPDAEFAALLTRAGVPAIPFDRSWRSWATAASTAEEKVMNVDTFVAEYIAATYDTLAKATEGSDMLVASGMLHFIAGSVAEKVGIPHRFAVFCPSLLKPQGWQGRVRAPINAHRISIGLPPVDDVRAYLLTERPWLAADPTLIRGHEPEAHTAIGTPAWILPDERPLPADLVAFLDAGTPPVYVGFGSMLLSQDSARVGIEAIRANGRRVLLAQGWAHLARVDERDDCFVVGEVNQQALFGRVAAAVHHGGAGTTTTAARAGAPQVVVPQAADQSYWAGRVTELGIGVAHNGPTPSIASLSAALTTALTPAIRDRAGSVAGMIRTDGATVAAKLLLEAANR